MEINSNGIPSDIKQVEKNQIDVCKERMRSEMKKESDFNKTDDLIRKILQKTDSDPTSSNDCVKWLGPAMGSIRVWGRVYYVRRLLYHWYISDVSKTDNIVNKATCKFNMCCNIKHLTKMGKNTSYKKEGKTYYGSSRNIERSSDHKRNFDAMKRDDRTNPKKKKKIPIDSVKMAWEKIKGGAKINKVAHDCKLSTSTVRHIAKGSAWNRVTGLPLVKPNSGDGTSKSEISKKKRANYLKRHCQYEMRKGIAKEEIPTEKELYRIMRTMSDSFSPLTEYDESVDGNTHCVYAPKVIRHRGKRLSRARLIYYWFNGDIPPGSKIIKTCRDEKKKREKDQGECMRPEHLSIHLDGSSESEQDDGYESFNLIEASSDEEEEFLLEENTECLFDGLDVI